MNFETTIPSQHCTHCGKWSGASAILLGQPIDHLCACPSVERRENRKAEPLDADHARIGELLLAYGSACAAYHAGPEVTRAYQACMAEIERQFKC